MFSRCAAIPPCLVATYTGAAKMNPHVIVELFPPSWTTYGWIVGVFVSQAAAWFALGVIYSPVVIGAMQ